MRTLSRRELLRFAGLAAALARIASVGGRAHHRLAAVVPLPLATLLRRLTSIGAAV